MPKKKKTQLKPVARGFAVTSVPKKTAQENIDEPRTISNDEAVDQQAQQKDHTSITPDLSDSKEQESEKAEKQALQNLVDSLQERTEKEIARWDSRSWFDFMDIDIPIRNIKVGVLQ